MLIHPPGDGHLGCFHLLGPDTVSMSSSSLLCGFLMALFGAHYLYPRLILVNPLFPHKRGALGWDGSCHKDLSGLIVLICLDSRASPVLWDMKLALKMLW